MIRLGIEPQSTEPLTNTLTIMPKVGSPNDDTYYFEIVAGVLHGDTLAKYLFIICRA